MSSIDQQFVEFIVKSLVGNPDDVKIIRTIDEKGVLLKLEVAGDDLGRVIGKRGATAQSIRTLLRALGTKHDARYNLKIIDTGEPREKREEREERAETPPAPKPVREEKIDSHSESQVETPEVKAPEVQAPKAETSTEEPKEQSYADKQRAELAEFDDLDI